MAQIRLLTGAIIEMRKLKTRDVDYILSAKPRAFLSSLITTLANCTVEVIEVGIYSLPFDWRKVYEGDWFDALFQLRSLSLGDDYTFQTRCPSRRCQEKSDVNYLLSELKRKLPTEEMLISLKERNNRFVRAFSQGEVEILQPTAEEAIAIANSRRAGSINAHKATDEIETDNELTISNALETKILKIILGSEKLEGQKKNAYLQDLDIDVAGELMDLIESNIFGVELELAIDCPACHEVMEFALPLAKTFFLKKLRK
jgi:hypothetical protein